MRVKLTLQQLEAFVQVAALGNFRAAAQALHVSQPALSRTVRMAEQLANARLFDRDTRHVELTAAGRTMLPIARRILDDFQSGFSELAQFVEGRSGHVTVAALPSVLASLLPPAIAAFRARHPQVGFTMVEVPAPVLHAQVDAGQADFGISVQPPPNQRLRYRHLLDDPFVMVCRRDDPLAQRSAVSWSEFGRRPFLASSTGSSIRSILDGVFQQKGIHPNETQLYPSVAAAGALIEAGLGITALPQLALRLINRESLTVVPLQKPVINRPIGILTHAGRSLSPVTQAFIDTLVPQREPPREA